jgi:hypothetical protein
MPLPPPSSKKHCEPPRELATVCQKGNMFERNGATEKFDLPRRWKRILVRATISGIVQAGAARKFSAFDCVFVSTTTLAGNRWRPRCK